MIGLVIAFAILAIVFGVIETIWPALPQKRWRRGMTTDLAYWLFTPLVSRALAGIATIAVAVVLAKLAGVPIDKSHVTAFIHRARWFGGLPRALQIAIVIVGSDFVSYWLHRAFHRGRLWRYHAIHHSSVELDWLSATRLHPINEIVVRMLAAIPLLAIGIDPVVVVAYVPALTLYAIAIHSNVPWSFGPLRYVIATPTFHRWHHTSQAEGRDKNFAGLLPIWDLIFGTFYMPRGELPKTFGVDEAIPENLVGQLAWPFRRR